MANLDVKNWEFLKDKDDEIKPLTLMHMLMMVFNGADPTGVGKNQRAFFHNVLSTGITKFTGVERGDTKTNYVTALLRKELKSGITQSKCNQIYEYLLGSTAEPDNYDFQSLYKQYDDLKGLGKENPEGYAKTLWRDMDICRRAIDASYLGIFQKRSPWLFRDHKDVLEVFDAERTYKLLTVAIAISLNWETSTTEETNDPLDKLCKEFLYAPPPEELPAFTLHEVFDALFPNAMVFAVKQGRSSDYVPVSWDSLTERDKLKILIPWLDPAYDLHPDSGDEAKAENAAKALMNNKIDEITGDNLRGFFNYFCAYHNNVWDIFVRHIQESLLRCSWANQMVVDKNRQINAIGEALNKQLPPGKIHELSESFYNILKSDLPWTSITRDKFWNGGLVDISLPEKWSDDVIPAEKDKLDEEVEQLYRYIAAFVLVALCCVKAGGDGTPEKRKEFQTALMQILHKSAESVHAHAEYQKINHELEMTRSAIRELIDDWLQELRQSSNIDRRADILKTLKRLIQLAKFSREEMISIMNALNKEEAKSRQLRNDPPGWDNGGN